MTIKFNLTNKSRKTSPIRLVVNHGNKQYRRCTGLTCDTARWSDYSQRSGNRKVDDRLKEIHMQLTTMLDQFSTPEDINDALDFVIFGESRKKNTPTFMEAFKEWSERKSTSIRQNRLAYNNILSLMGQASWEQVDEVYCHRLIRLMEAKDWGINYRGNMVKAVKAVMNEGYKLGYHKNTAFKDFKAPHSEVDNIYLTASEMEKIWESNPKSSMDKKARDLAWLGYLTCARFSDYSRMSEDNIGDDGKIRFTQTKTSKAVVLPCSPRVREILTRYDGKAPALSHQKFNEHIKALCREVGICDKVETVRIEGTERVRQTHEKWELVTSHTFRRSAATNLYLQGVPLRSIMQLTGHRTLSALEKYLKVGGEENAERLAGIDFFK